MGNGNSVRNGQRFRIPPEWFFFILIIGILTLSTMAFFSPISQGVSPTATPSVVVITQVVSCTPDVQMTPTVALPPPTPDEIGYTNGIIFWSTILILILLIGTLREILRKNKKMDEQNNLSERTK